MNGISSSYIHDKVYYKYEIYEHYFTILREYLNIS